MHPGLVHGIARGRSGHVAGVLALRGDPPLFDPCPGGDPLIAGIDDFFEISVGEDPLRNVAAGPNNGNGAARLAGPRPRDFLHCSA